MLNALYKEKRKKLLMNELNLDEKTAADLEDNVSNIGRFIFENKNKLDKEILAKLEKMLKELSYCLILNYDISQGDEDSEFLDSHNVEFGIQVDTREFILENLSEELLEEEDYDFFSLEKYIELFGMEINVIRLFNSIKSETLTTEGILEIFPSLKFLKTLSRKIDPSVLKVKINKNEIPPEQNIFVINCDYIQTYYSDFKIESSSCSIYKEFNKIEEAKQYLKEEITDDLDSIHSDLYNRTDIFISGQQYCVQNQTPEEVMNNIFEKVFSSKETLLKICNRTPNEGSYDYDKDLDENSPDYDMEEDSRFFYRTVQKFTITLK
jgi:hypothetical protein